MTDTSHHAARKERAAFVSILASFAIALGKLCAGLLTGSLAMLSEAGHAIVDTCATIVTWWAVRAAERPADNEHHYGHGKFESLAALVETALLFALTAFVTIEATHRLISGDYHIDAQPIAFVVLLLSIAIDATRWRALSKVARETKSEALAADALHFSSDMIGSLLVLIGFIAAALGFPQADALASFGVAAFVAIAGYRLGRTTIDTLLDAAPRGLAERLTKAIANQPGVVSIDFLRVRPAGHQIFGEIGVGVARSLPLERVAEIKARALQAIADIEPNALMTLTTRALAVDDETATERVMLAASRMGLSVHHVTIQRICDKISISLDLELDRKMSLRGAHDLASLLEGAIRDEIGDGVEVDTHIEPLEINELAGVDAAPELTVTLQARLEAQAEETGLVREIHNVRLRRTESGLILNYHCRLPSEVSVEQAHDCVDHIDRALRREHPDLIRVVGHAEPLPPPEN